MKLSFSTLGCPGWNMEEITENAVKYGYEGVELRVKGKQHVDTGMDVAGRKLIKDIFNKNKLDICCLGGYTYFCSDKTEELEINKNLLLKYIDLAVDLGAPYVRTFIGAYPSTLTEDEVVQNAANYLNICGEKAEAKDVRILIETHDTFSTEPSRLKKSLNC